MLLTSKKKSTPIKFIFNFDKFPIHSIDNFLNLGAIFDSSFNISSFINSKIRTSNFHLFRIRGISKSTLFARKTLVTSLVLSVINYCSILLSGLPAYKIKPLEPILRSAVRVAHNIPYCEKNNDISITLLIAKLNWLSVANRIKYKS